MRPATLTERFAYHDLQPRHDSFLAEVVQGLSGTQKHIPSKFLYDLRGSQLFEEICDLPEYYPTRAETDILREHSREMADLAGDGCLLIEYGSGNSRKTLILLDELNPAAYLPVDLAADQLRHSAASLAYIYPGLKVVAVCADYTRPMRLSGLDGVLARRRVVFFPGSTIGNFTPAEARQFLANAASLVGPGGAMLVGVDLKKDPALLHAAYNDSQGVTAAFNLNLLARMNRELGANFEPAAFRHYAFYNTLESRVEMHLVSLKTQRVDLPGLKLVFREGETIHTENSYKYTVEEFQRLASEAGFAPAQVWMDAERQFSVHYLVVRHDL